MPTEMVIGTLNEGPLHAALKEWYRRPGDRVEVPVEGFVADLVRGDRLIEIQTGGFSAMRRKFDHLLDVHPIQLVHPVAAQKWIVKLDADGGRVSRRRSPRRGIAADVCAELVSFPSLLSHPNFALDVALVAMDEVWAPDPRGHRRGGFAIQERHLVEMVDVVELREVDDLLALVPSGLPDPFSSADLARALGRTRHQAREVAYCLRIAGVVGTDGRDARGIRYRRPDATSVRHPPHP